MITKYALSVEPVNRKVTFRLYPTLRQAECLEHVFTLHQRLYNVALECKELTALRKECEEYRELNAQSCQVTLKRLDLAFRHFFRRVKQGDAKAGFPRFKARDRFSGFGFKTHGDGFRIESPGKHGYVRLSGIGMIRMRGKARSYGEVCTAEVLRKQSRWYLSVTVKCQPRRQSGTSGIGIDWGLETFATLAVSDGSYKKVENPRHLRKSLQKLRKAQRDVTRKKRGSKNRQKAIRVVQRVHQRVAQQRKDHLHQTSHAIISQAALVATEELSVKNMTAKGGSYKKGLNREILSTSPGMFFSFLKYKAEEAGIFWKEIPTREVKPSQTCSNCGRQEKKALSQRTHPCSCGLVLGRDENAARVILNWALTQDASGWEPSRCGEGALVPSLKQETHAISA